MALARGLILAALGEPCGPPDLADEVLGSAADLDVDPLDYCMQGLGLGTGALKRAAHWAGFGFSDELPLLPGRPQIVRLDHLADIRTMRRPVRGRDLTFCAPRFTQLLRLAEARLTNPDLVRHLCIVPAAAIRAHLAAACSDQLLQEARQRLTRRWPFASANVDLPMGVRIAFVVLFVLVTTSVAVAPFYLSELLLPFIAVLLLVPAAIRIAAAFAPVPPPPAVPLLDDAELPVYTILMPLRDEAAMVPLLRQAISELDYPAEKMDVKFVVEAKSTDTVAAVQAVMAEDPRFELIPIPDAEPHTKPKALNYALPLARGEHLVVFDAEDIPERQQLRLAASTFATDPGLDCIQAELVVDNAEENWITAMFAAEYAGQFGLLLPLLAHLHLPLPLGGTSNHFRTAALRELGHWDAYNVTEDADLGVRLSRLRYRTGVLRSDTLEEAPISVGAWMVQRTRWIKGWMRLSSNNDFRREIKHMSSRSSPQAHAIATLSQQSDWVCLNTDGCSWPGTGADLGDSHNVLIAGPGALLRPENGPDQYGGARSHREWVPSEAVIRQGRNEAAARREVVGEASAIHDVISSSWDGASRASAARRSEMPNILEISTVATLNRLAPPVT